ncbi:MAG: DinB family protein [Bacteroidota bacterium]
MTTSELKWPDSTVFYKSYVDLLDEADLMPLMTKQLENFPKFIRALPDEKLQYSYGEGKWTVAQVLQHIIDAERVFQYRALRFVRGDQTELPGFNQDSYVEQCNVQNNSKESIIAEYSAVRNSSIALFNGLNREQLQQTGTASGKPWSVGHLGFVICGHQKHHRNSIRERYL